MSGYGRGEVEIDGQVDKIRSDISMMDENKGSAYRPQTITEGQNAKDEYLQMQKQMPIANVASEIFKERHMDILRAKIAKRLALDKKEKDEVAQLKAIYVSSNKKVESKAQQALQDIASRKDILKILTDNKQKLYQTREELFRHK